MVCSYLGCLYLLGFVAFDCSLCTVAVTSMILKGFGFGLANFLIRVYAVVSVADRIFCFFYY